MTFDVVLTFKGLNISRNLPLANLKLQSLLGASLLMTLPRVKAIVQYFALFHWFTNTFKLKNKNKNKKTPHEHTHVYLETNHNVH